MLPSPAPPRRPLTAARRDEPFRIVIGWDTREPIAFAVLAHSILTRATRPVSITPLAMRSVRHAYTRPRGPTEATEFSLTRFLVPWLSGYQGWTLFMDCDMLCLADINDILLYAVADPGKAVYVCHHDYVPRGLTKFDGHEQTRYPRKNWSSVMLFNNALCEVLTPEFVNSTSGLILHRLLWTDEALIGTLPLDWNYLVGEDNQSPAPPKLIHYTNGGPWFVSYADVEYADAWRREYAAAMAPWTQ